MLQYFPCEVPMPCRCLEPCCLSCPVPSCPVPTVLFRAVLFPVALFQVILFQDVLMINDAKKLSYRKMMDDYRKTFSGSRELSVEDKSRTFLEFETLIHSHENKGLLVDIVTTH